MTQKTYRGLWIITLLVLLAVYFKNAWVSDDGFIIFRSIEQLFEGNGPRWNPHERIQTFTSPLWFVVLCVIRVISSDVYLNIILVSCLLLVGTFLVVSRMKLGVWFVPLVAFFWVSSNGFYDYTSSGLENVLAYFLFAIYLYHFLKLSEFSDSDDSGDRIKLIRWIMIVSGLIIFVRHDLLLLVFPPSVYVLVRHFKLMSLKDWGYLGILSVLPFGAFTLFSIVYFGFPFPNTAYAKLSTGIPSGDLIKQGLLYYQVVTGRDSITVLVIGLSLLVNLIKPSSPAIRFLCLGVILNLLYVLKVGGDFMQGRFLSYAFLICTILLLRWLINLGNKHALIYCVLVLAGYNAVYPHTPLKSPLSVGDVTLRHGVADERLFYFHGTAFAKYLKYLNSGQPFPRHRFTWEGIDFAESSEDTAVQTYVGLFGYFAGVDKKILDPLALPDPLLARLPCRSDWRIGHFERDLPAGYLETFQTGENVIESEPLREYFDKIRIITEEERLLSGERLRTILEFNLGNYDHLLEEYVQSMGRDED